MPAPAALDLIAAAEVDQTVQTFVHEFPGSPVRQPCKALAARHGLNVYPVFSFEGRNCIVIGEQRIRRREGWGYFNSYSVKFLDGTLANIPAGRFNTKAKPPEPKP